MENGSELFPSIHVKKQHAHATPLLALPAGHSHPRVQHPIKASMKQTKNWKETICHDARVEEIWRLGRLRPKREGKM